LTEQRRLFKLLLSTALSYPVGLLVGVPLLLPILNAAPGYLAMIDRLQQGDRRSAVKLLLVWALTLAVCGALSLALWPASVESHVINGVAYRDEMFRWIRTGEGREGHLSGFLPQHLLHLAAYVALCLATASVVSILMGAVLMNYMSFYVVSLARAGVPLTVVLALGWPPYAIARVTAFCILGAVLAEPLLAKVRRYPYEGLRGALPYLRIAALLILADWTIKALVAPLWASWLRAYL